MKRATAGITVLALSVALGACYHAVVETGLPMSPETIDRPWASGWIYGLVPPKPLDAASRCRNGVAKVETRLSFLNQIVNGLTLGIYTPMSMKVTCASTGAAQPPGSARIDPLSQTGH
jgi:hypothetical protein